MLRLLEVAIKANGVVDGQESLKLGVKARIPLLMNQKQKEGEVGPRVVQKKLASQLEVQAPQAKGAVADHERVTRKNRRVLPIKVVPVVAMTKANNNILPEENGISEAICQPMVCLVN